MAVKFCVSCSFIFNLSATSGKYSFVVFSLHVCVHFLCHFFALFSSRSFITTLFGILLYLSEMFLFVAALFANCRCTDAQAILCTALCCEFYVKELVYVD